MIQAEKLVADLEAIRKQSPLVHNITNFVVMNNTANALLAIGASPVMAHAIEEVEEMASIAGALVINIGTLSSEWVKAMEVAGKTARKRAIPIVFDPVGAGATSFRTETCLRLIEAFRPTIIRGNGSEIMALVKSNVQTKGVDSSVTSSSALEAAKALALQTSAIVVISGETDYITDGTKVEEVRNGSPMMTRVTGLGCTATAVIGAFAAINTDPFEAAVHGMAAMGIAGELSSCKANGTGTMQLLFLDELYNLNKETIYNTIC